MLRQAVIALGLVSLASCGGGGGDSGNPTEIQNRAPALGAIGNQMVTEGATDVVTVTAADADGDALSFSLSGDDAGAFSISNTGVITFNEAPDFEAPGDANADNTYDVTVTVSDGSLSDEESFMVMVDDVLEGRAVDGPISGATVTLLSRSAGSTDAFAEVATTTTDENGRFNFPDIDNEAYDYKITTRGGTDTVTNKNLGNLTFVAKVPKAGAGSTTNTNVNAITTVLSVVETEEEQQELLGKLGIDATPDELTNSDIWEGSEEGDEESQDAQRVNSQLTTVINTVSNVVEQSTDEEIDPTELVETVAAEIVEASETQSDTELDLSDSELIADVITDTVEDVDPEAEVAEEVVQAVSNAVSNVNSVLGDETQDPTGDTAAGVAAAAQEDLQTSVTDVASGQTDVAAFEEETAAENLLDEVPTEPDAPDNDGDGIPDAIDVDDDNDGVRDSADAFPFDPAVSRDTDGDGEANDYNAGATPEQIAASTVVIDTDDDGDSVLDVDDAYPLASNYSDTAFDARVGKGVYVIDYDPTADENIVVGVDNWTTTGGPDVYSVYVNLANRMTFNAQNINNALSGGVFQAPELVIDLRALPSREGIQSATASISIVDHPDSVAAGDVARSINVVGLSMTWTADGEMAEVELPPQTLQVDYITSDNLALDVTIENLDPDFLTIGEHDFIPGRPEGEITAPATLDVKLLALLDKVQDFVPGFLTTGMYIMEITLEGVPMVASRNNGTVDPVDSLYLIFKVGE